MLRKRLLAFAMCLVRSENLVFEGTLKIFYCCLAPEMIKLQQNSTESFIQSISKELGKLARKSVLS